MINCAEYGKALFLLALEENLDDVIFQEIKALTDIFRENNEYITILDSPAIMLDEKLSMIDNSLGGCHEYIKNFLKILCEKHSVFQFENCVKAFSKEYSFRYSSDAISSGVASLHLVIIFLSYLESLSFLSSSISILLLCDSAKVDAIYA